MRRVKAFTGFIIKVCVYLLIEATAEGTPAYLHQTLRGDQHLIGPLPCRQKQPKIILHITTVASGCFILEG